MRKQILTTCIYNFHVRSQRVICIRTFRKTCLLATLLACLGLWLASAASAQQNSGTDVSFPAGDDVSNPSAPPASTSDEPLIRLSIKKALLYSLEGNQDIQLSAYGPHQAREDLLNVESVYDPLLFLSGTKERLLDTESDIDSPTMDNDTSVKLGIKKMLTTGGTVSVFWETQRFDKSYDPFNFEERYTSAPGVELRQPLLKNYGAKAQKAAINIQNNNLSISEADFEQTVHHTVAQISQIYWRLYMYWKFVDINKQTFYMAKEVHRREKARLAAGLSKSLDVARAKSAMEARRTDIFRAKERVRRITEEFKFLLNASAGGLTPGHGILPVDLPKTGPVKVLQDEAVNQALTNRPEIMKARRNLEIANIKKNLSDHQKLPKLDAVMSYSVNGYGSNLSDSVEEIAFNDRNSWSVGLTMEVPFGNRAAKANYRKQDLVHKQAGDAVRQVEDQIRMEIKQVFWSIDFAKKEITSTRLENAQAEIVVTGEFERFELGQMTNEELLRAQDFLANARRNYIQAVVKYNIALSDLDRVRNVLPHGLEIEKLGMKNRIAVSPDEARTDSD